MKTLQFSKEIKAPARKVWDLLWNEDTYAQWTSGFNPDGGSVMKSDWQVGGKTLFLDSEGRNGMVSTIKSKNEPYEMVFEHLGEVVDGKEDTTSERVKGWAGSLEEYHLSEKDGITTLIATTTTDEKWAEMLTAGFNKGLAVLKELAEEG